jgi:hypothetical protein
MKTSLPRFALAAVAGLSILALAQTPVHAQFRRVPVVRPVPVVPVTPAPRLPVVVPPVRSYTNPYILPGLTVNQLGVLSALSADPTMLPLINSYYNMYRPISITSVYPTVPYTTPYLPYMTTTIGTPGIVGNPYNFYNPYFAAFGLYP